jgi:hypothetical protein
MFFANHEKMLTFSGAEYRGQPAARILRPPLIVKMSMPESRIEGTM